MSEQTNQFQISEVRREEIEDFLKREWKPVNMHRFGRYDEAMWDVQHYALAAFHGDSPVGAVVFKVEAGLGKITQIITAADRRGEGVGRALMESVEDICRRERCHKVTLKTYWDSDAQRFYHTQGYVVEGILRRDLHGIDMCQMCKFL